MPDLLVGVASGQSYHRGTGDAFADEVEEDPVGMERHVDDQIGGGRIKTSAGGSVSPALRAVTGGAGLDVDSLSDGERFGIGGERVPFGR